MPVALIQVQVATKDRIIKFVKIFQIIPLI